MKEAIEVIAYIVAEDDRWFPFTFQGRANVLVKRVLNRCAIAGFAGFDVIAIFQSSFLYV